MLVAAFMGAVVVPLFELGGGAVGAVIFLLLMAACLGSFVWWLIEQEETK